MKANRKIGKDGKFIGGLAFPFFPAFLFQTR